jgi:hypothetical protein
MVLELALDGARWWRANRPSERTDVVNLALKQMAEPAEAHQRNPVDAALAAAPEQVLTGTAGIGRRGIVRGGCLIETAQGDSTPRCPHAGARWQAAT